MAYETGTADSSTHLLQKLNTFLTANGWTNIRGETDIVPASPKAARYWRILFLEVDSTTHDYRGVSKLEWRGTPGGANLATDGNAYYFRNLGSGSGANIVSGTGETYSTDVNDEL